MRFGKFWGKSLCGLAAGQDFRILLGLVCRCDRGHAYSGIERHVAGCRLLDAARKVACRVGQRSEKMLTAIKSKSAVIDSENQK